MKNSKTVGLGSSDKLRNIVDFLRFNYPKIVLAAQRLTGRGVCIQPSIRSIKLRNALPALASNELCRVRPPHRLVSNAVTLLRRPRNSKPQTFVRSNRV